MDLKNLTDAELDQSFKKYVQQEDEALIAVLEHICEAESRKMFMGCKNLFDYLTKHRKYSEVAAQARIDASRLYSEFPEIGEHLISRELKLSQLGILARGIRKAGKVSHEKKAEILATMKGKDLAASEVDPQTGEKCGSHFRTQVDHVQPLWAGGTSEPENLQILCQFHNKLKYEIEMESYFAMTRSELF